MILLVGYAVAGLSLLILPLRYLPMISLALFALVPASYISTDSLPVAFSPAVVVMLGWAIRANLARPTRSVEDVPRWRWLGWLWAASILLVVASSWISGTLTNNPWLLAFFASYFLIPLLGFHHVSDGFSFIGPAWAWLTSAISVYAIVERLLSTNLIYGAVFASGPQALDQKWSVYRAMASIGHPLLTSAFLAIGVAIAFGLIIEAFRWRWLFAILLGVGGVVATSSRSGLLALAVGIAVILVAGLARRFRRTLRSILILAPILILSAFFAASFLADRLVSTEAQESSAYRDTLLSIGTQVATQAPFGGLGATGLAAAASRAGLPTGGNFENSWIELAIAFGAITAATIALVLLGFAARAVAIRSIGAVGAMICFIVSASSFNSFFGHPSSLYILSALMLFCVTQVSSANHSIPSTRPHRRRLRPIGFLP